METTFYSYLLPLMKKVGQMKSSLKGKNLLLEEQIPSLKSWPPLKKGGKNNNDRRAAFSKCVPIHISYILILWIYICGVY